MEKSHKTNPAEEATGECFIENRSNHYLSIIISLCLFIGGIIILGLRIPGWSLFLGLPAIQVGAILLIFSFDNLARKNVGIQSLQVLECSICRQPTVAPKWKKEAICETCQKEIAQEALGKKS